MGGIDPDEGKKELINSMKKLLANSKEREEISQYTPSGLGKRIAEVAKEVGGKRKLAELIKISEVQLYRYLNLQSVPNIETIVKIANAAKVRLEWLIAGSGYPRSSNDDTLRILSTTLKELDRHGWPIDRIAKEVDISENELTAYYLGEKLPNLDVLIKIAERTPISLDYLLTGKHLHLKQGDIAQDDRYTSLQLFDPAEIYLKNVMAGELSVQPLLFNKEWLKYQFKCDIGDLMYMHVNDDAMWPTYAVGGIVIIDKRFSNKAMPDGVYIIRLNGTYSIRRVQTLLRAQRVLTSDNWKHRDTGPNYLDDDDLDLIVGKVVWYGHVFISPP